MTKTLSASAERQLERRANHKLAVLWRVEEVSGSVAATCHYYGISRQAYYHWIKRYEAEGVEGLRDRSGTPHRDRNDGHPLVSFHGHVNDQIRPTQCSWVCGAFWNADIGDHTDRHVIEVR